jgi:hypothetical protein
MNCAHCQSLLLDHLYGLLDGAEADALDAHLAACPACAGVRAETARVQGLIARAAKGARATAPFEPPVPAPASVPNAPASTPVAEPARRGRPTRFAAVVSWAVAAAVLIAVPSTVVPVLNAFDSAERAKAEAEVALNDADRFETDAFAVRTKGHSRLKALESKLTAAEQARAALLNNWVEDQRRAVDAATARRLTVDVVKPAAVQPGAPNDFLVVVRDARANWENTGKRMVAEVHAVDASDAVIFSQTLDHERRGESHHLRLPASAWAKVKPNSELFLVLAQVDEKTQARSELQERVKLAGPVYATLLATDRAVYRPGERVHFRSLTLDRTTFQPPAREQLIEYELLAPDGKPVPGAVARGTTELVRVLGEGRVEPVRAANGKPVRGVGCAEFDLPPDLPEGDYTLRLSEQRHPAGYAPVVPAPATRTILVRRAPLDVYRKEIGFTAASYQPGETVEAWAEAKLQDKPAAGVAIDGVTVTADGAPVAGAIYPERTDFAGRARVRFVLPPEVLAGDVRVKVAFRTATGTESATARVPVIANHVKVEFFPESSGKLIAGVPNRVYVRATTPAGQPVEFRGVVTDGRRAVAEVSSLNDPDQPGANRGLASFTFTPQLGTRVWLKLLAPNTVYAPVLTGVPVLPAQVALGGGALATAARTGFELPEPALEGVVMSVLDPVTAPGQPIRVELHSVGRTRALVVGAYTRGRLSDTQKVTVDPGAPQLVKLMAGADPRGGVVRVTVFEEVGGRDENGDPRDLRPVAERLVFRKPGEVLNLALEAGPTGGQMSRLTNGGAPAFPAGTELQLRCTATDEKGNPAAAVLWAAAVNSGVAPGAKDRLLPTHFLLAGEIKSPDELEYADFLLTDHPKAGGALDLLLGTQGWRRFAEQRALPPALPKGKGAPPNADLAKLAHATGNYATLAEPQPVAEHRKIIEKYKPQYQAASATVEQLKKALDAARAEPTDFAEAELARNLARTSHGLAVSKVQQAEAAREPLKRFASNVWYGVCGLAALALVCGFVAVARPAVRLPCGVSTLGALGLAAFLVVAAGWAEPVRAAALEAAAPGAEVDRNAAALERPRAPSAVRPPSDADGALASNAKPGVASGKAEWVGAGGVPPAPSTKGGFEKGPGGPLPPKSPFGGFVGGGIGGGPALPAAPGAGAPGSGSPGPLPGQPPPLAFGPYSDTLLEVHKADVRLRDRALSAATARGSDKGLADEKKNAHKDRDAVNRFAAERAKVFDEALEVYQQALQKKKPANEPETIRARRIEDHAVRQFEGEVAPPAPLVVREYAAPRPLPAADAELDVPDTVLWHPVIVLPTDGKTTLAFALGSAPGGYELVVAGHTLDGRLGAERRLVRVAPGAPNVSVPPPAPPVPQAPRAP